VIINGRTGFLVHTIFLVKLNTGFAETMLVDLPMTDLHQLMDTLLTPQVYQRY
jgi:hypothetical protein